MAPCTHPGMKRLFCLKATNGIGRFAPSALPHYLDKSSVIRVDASYVSATVLVERKMRQGASYFEQGVFVRRKKKFEKEKTR